jgi:hypothetical protein
MKTYKNWNRATDADTPASAKDALNMTLNGTDGSFFISYAGDMNLMRAKFGVKTMAHDSETALMIRGAGLLGHPQAFVLEGDHRDAYEEHIDNLAACLHYWAKTLPGNAEAGNKLKHILCGLHNRLEDGTTRAAEIIEAMNKRAKEAK